MLATVCLIAMLGAPEVALDDAELFPGVRLTASHVRLTVGGFAEMVAIYRQHYVSEDIATSYWSLPFATRSQYYAPELRLSSRQTRLSLHGATQPALGRQGTVHLEVDFLGAATTANSVQSNSFTPRLRQGYGSFVAALGPWRLAVVAGQAWSLVTQAGPGLAMGTEAPPPGLDGQFMPGFLWARQPQVRLTAHRSDLGLTLAASLENPQTTFISAAPAGAVTTVAGGFLFNPAAKMSLSRLPDGIVKVAYDLLGPRLRLHGEAAGVGRVFFVRSTKHHNEHVFGGGGAASMRIVLPRAKDLQVTAAVAYGRGLGRYGSAQFADATLDAQAIPRGKAMAAALLGLELTPAPALRLFAYAGMEGVGPHNDLAAADNSGCGAIDGACSGANRRVDMLTGGFWAVLAQAESFRLRLGVQYAVMRRALVPVAGVAPVTQQQQGYVGLRCDL